MSFWDELLNSIGNGNRVSGSPHPAGTFPQGRAGSVQLGSSAMNTITDRLRQYNDDRNGSGGWHSSMGSQRSLDGGYKYGLGGSIGSQLSRNVEPPGSDLNDILARLEELQNPDRYMTDSADLSRQAMAAASAQYDPIIASLRQQAEGDTQRANINKVELGQMFNSLSGSLQGDIPAIQKQYAGDKATSKQQFADLQGQIKQQYATSQTEQEDMMKRLGIQAAASETLPEQQRDRDYFTNLAGKEGQTQQSALGEEETGSVDYTRQGSQIARTEGVQRQADVMTQLQDLLHQYESQIGANQAAKQNAYTAGLGQLQSQMMNDASDRADRESSNFLQMINLGRDLRSDEYKYNAQAPSTAVKSPADIAQRVLGLGMNDRQAQSIQDVFMSALSKDPVIQSGTTGFGMNVPKEQLAQRVVNMGRQQHFSQPALNALMTVALEYFGRR